ncbi:MAG: TIM barrel protein [Bacillota bacterium]|nr:TIM barrel protein [Bacillota bacterium]
MKKALCLETIYTDIDFYNRFGQAARDGYQYVEFWAWQDKDLDRILALCQENNLEVAAFSGDQDYSLCDALQAGRYIDFISRSILAAKKLGSPFLVIHSNALGEGGVVIDHYASLSDAEKYAACLETLKQCAILAEQSGVTLVLEPLNSLYDHAGNYLTTPDITVRLVRAVASPAIKMLFDIYHMQIMTGNIINTLTKYREEIGYIHVADVPGRKEPGAGEINYANVFRALRDQGYTGFVGLECFPDPPFEQVATLFLKM